MSSKLRNLTKKTVLAFIYRLPPIPQKLHGKFIWVHPRARFSHTTRTFFEGERHVQTWLNYYLKPGDVFFDIGAHHGWVSMWAMSLVGKKGVVCSFEPSPANLHVQEWHKNVNHFSQWTIVSKAVSDRDEVQHAFFLIDAGDSPMNSLTSGVPGMPLMAGRDLQTISVQTITLDTFCGETRVLPNLLKIDVEGAELLVLRGAQRVLKECHPTIILAVHPYWLPAGQSPTQIAELLKAYDYTISDSKGKLVEALGNGEYLCLNAARA